MEKKNEQASFSFTGGEGALVGTGGEGALVGAGGEVLRVV